MITGKEHKNEFQLHLKHGEPMIFGNTLNKGVRLNGTKLEAVTIGENGITEEDILVHDQYDPDPGIQLMLAKMGPPNLPMALGVIRSAKFPTYDDLLEDQISVAKATSPIKNVDTLLNSGETFVVK